MFYAHEQGDENGNDEVQENVKPKRAGNCAGPFVSYRLEES
jgi:hypothetical protein